MQLQRIRFEDLHQTERIKLTKTNEILEDANRRCRSQLESELESMVRSGLTIAQLRARRGEEIRAIIQNCVQEAFLAGEDYAQRAIEGGNVRLTKQDLNLIERISDKMEQDFWGVLVPERFRIVSETDSDKKTKALRKITEVTLASIAVTALAEALNRGTLSGAKQIREQDRKRRPNKRGQLFEFVTMRDDRVDCRICKPIDGLIFGENYSDLPVPPLHPNCRCRLLLRKVGVTLSG